MLQASEGLTLSYQRQAHPAKYDTMLSHTGQLQLRHGVRCHRRPSSAARRNAVAVCSASVRERKDPKQFRSMDEARAYLHQRNGNGAVSLAGALNWLSSNAFGAQQQELNWVRIVRLLLGFSSSSSSTGATLPQHPITSEAIRLSGLLLCSPAGAAAVIHRCPQVLQQGPAQVASRLTALKQALPEVDISMLVERLPQHFLAGDSAATCAQVEDAYATLRHGLPGADVAAMVQEDPALLFVELQSGIEQLHDLWEVDEDALAASDPAMLGLAVRALSRAGPPHRF